MFLIPILGINFLLLPIRPAGGSSFEYLYDIVSTIFSSFQGAFIINSMVFTLISDFRSLSELPPLLPKRPGQTDYEVKTSQHFLNITSEDKCGNDSKIE